MTLDRYFHLSSYALLGAGGAMLAATGGVERAALATYLAALVAGWLIDDGKTSWALPARWSARLRLAALPLLALDWRILGSTPARVAVHLVFFFAICRLLQRKTGRDWLWLYLAAFLQLLLAAGMTIDATFLALIVVFLLAAISSLVSYELRRARGQDREEIECWREEAAGRKMMGPPRWRALAWFSALALGAILALAAPLFLAMPRLARGLLGNGMLRGEALSGFNNSVRLGEVAQVKLNPQVVMRVRVRPPDAQPARRLRWRGVSFDHYDGRTWSESGGQWKSARRSGEGFLLEPVIERRPLTETQFFLEPIDLTNVFAAPRAVWARDLPALQRDPGDGLWTENHAAHRFRYTIYSDTWTPDEAALLDDAARFYPPEVRRRYLQLPPDRDRRIDELAAELTRGAATPLEAARRIERHLQTAYGYTLDLRRIDDGDPVADFLFNTKAGHCEYFATAMTLLLRSRRIPARLVNGFQMGQFSPVSDAWIVRQSDAHSWVEVYFARHGWIAFDPTPAAGLSRYEGGWSARLRQYFEAFDLFWQERVVGFGTRDQVGMFIGAQRLLASAQQGALSRFLAWRDGLGSFDREPGETPSGESIISLAAPGLALLAAALWLIYSHRAQNWRRWPRWPRWRKWQRWRRRLDPSSSAAAFYREMLRALEPAGYAREGGQTPREFARAVPFAGVAELTDLYQRARYGAIELTETDESRVDELLRELKRAARRARLRAR